MLNKTVALAMPDGNKYSFYGQTFYGEHTASSITNSTYNVSISGFTSECLVVGVKVSIRFSYAFINGAAYLNVSNTGYKGLEYLGSTNSQNLWQAGQVVDFVYDGTHWQVINNNFKIFTGLGGSNSTSDSSKVATVAGFTSASLADGVMVLLSMPVNTSASAITLNVQETGSYSVVDRESTNDGRSVYQYPAGEYLFVFDKHSLPNRWIMCGYARLSDSTYLDSSTTYASSKAVLSVYNAVVNKYTKPSTGIPATDLAAGVIPTNVSSLTNDAGYLTLATLPVWDGSVT